MITRVRDGDTAHLSLLKPSSNGPPDTGALRRVGPAPHLQASDIEELRNAIAESLCNREVRDSADGDVDEELRRSLRIACMKARLQRVRAEHLLIDVKKLWATIPRAPDARTDDQLSEIITACIDEYYGKGRVPPR